MADINYPIANKEEVTSQLAEKANKLKATNLVTNGDFSQGATGWSLGTNWSVTDGKAVSNGASGTYLQKYNAFTNLNVDKYYIAFDMRDYVSGSLLWLAAHYDKQLIFSGNGRKSAIVIPKVTIFYNYGGELTASVDNFVIINLTATFGAGNEPTKEEMDRLLSKYPNSWFDGTAEIANLKEIQGYKAEKLMATNLATNGDFSQGTTGWVASGGSMAVVNGELNFLATAQSQQAYQTNAYNGINKIYFAMMVKTTSALVGLRVFGLNEFAKGTGQYEIVSRIIAPSGSSSFGIQDTRVSGFDTIIVKNAMRLDLTSIFGAGNEPTKEQMDRLLAEFPNSWFDGTQEILPLKTVNELLNEKANKAQEAWTTPTLVNGWTGDIKYRKNEDGMVVVAFNNVIVPATSVYNQRIFSLPVGYRAYVITAMLLIDTAGSGKPTESLKIGDSCIVSSLRVGASISGTTTFVGV